MRSKIFLGFVLASFVCQWATAGVREEVKFKRGASSTIIEGGVIRGERDKYLIGAGKGQFLAVTLSSLEDNAVFAIYPPGAKEQPDDEISGNPLPGAAESKAIAVQLPTQGRYLIVVGGTRGNATYKLEVAITSTPPASAQLPKPAAPLAANSKLIPTILGGWVCSVTWESGPSVRPYAFFEDGTFVVSGDAGGGQTAIVSGTFALAGPKLEITESILRVVDKTGKDVVGWSRNAKGNDLSRTNYKIHEYRFAQSNAANFTMSRLRTSTGTGVSRDVPEKDQKAVNCAQSTELLIDLLRIRRSIPDTLFKDQVSGKNEAEQAIAKLHARIQNNLGRNCPSSFTDTWSRAESAALKLYNLGQFAGATGQASNGLSLKDAGGTRCVD